MPCNDLCGRISFLKKTCYSQHKHKTSTGSIYLSLDTLFPKNFVIQTGSETLPTKLSYSLFFWLYYVYLDTEDVVFFVIPISPLVLTQCQDSSDENTVQCS